MKAMYDPTSIARASTTLRNRLEQVRETVEHFPVAAKQDALPRVERLDTMVQALERDAEEIKMPHGATLNTVRALANCAEHELTDLEHEMNALAGGNPTTLDAALEAALRGIERARKALRKFNGKEGSDSLQN